MKQLACSLDTSGRILNCDEYFLLLINPYAVPGSPVNVSVSNVSSTNLMVTWKPPDLINQNGIIEGYTIELNQSRFTEIPPVKNITVTAGANNLLVSDLEEDTEYLVRVLAVNSVGDGPYNDGVSGITNEDSKFQCMKLDCNVIEYHRFWLIGTSGHIMAHTI